MSLELELEQPVAKKPEAAILLNPQSTVVRKRTATTPNSQAKRTLSVIASQFTSLLLSLPAVRSAKTGQTTSAAIGGDVGDVWKITFSLRVGDIIRNQVGNRRAGQSLILARNDNTYLSAGGAARRTMADTWDNTHLP